MAISFARPADTTAYLAGDVIASSTVAATASAALLSFVPRAPLLLSRVDMRRSQASITLAAFRLLLLTARPTLTNGDNGALAGNFFASIAAILELTAPNGRIAGSGAFGSLIDISGERAVLDEREYFLVLEARDGYTPASAETFEFEIHGTPVR